MNGHDAVIQILLIVVPLAVLALINEFAARSR